MGRRRTKPAGEGTIYPGVYSYETKAGTRFRCAWVNSDGKPEFKYGFRTPTAANGHRADMIAASRRGERRTAAADAFGPTWARWLAAKVGRDISPGTGDDYAAAYQRHLRVWADRPLRDLTYAVIDDQVTEWLAAGLWSRKTINNTIAALSSFLSDQVRAKLIPENPCRYLRRPSEDWYERDYLRLSEVEPYVAACSDLYRPLGEFLIATGARISEALGVQLPDLEFIDQGIVLIERQVPQRRATDQETPEPLRRRRGRRTARPTKGRSKRAVAVGPTAAQSIARRAALAGEMAPDTRRAYLFQMPPVLARGDRGGTQTFAPNTPLNRNTVSREWHYDALEAAGLIAYDEAGERSDDRDLPLHALRHSAAALWLAAGNDIEFVRRQLGHANITTTQRIYGHLEVGFLRERAAATERFIADARQAAEAAQRMPTVS